MPFPKFSSFNTCLNSSKNSTNVEETPSESSTAKVSKGAGRKFREKSSSVQEPSSKYASIAKYLSDESEPEEGELIGLSSKAVGDRQSKRKRRRDKLSALRKASKDHDASSVTPRYLVTTLKQQPRLQHEQRWSATTPSLRGAPKPFSFYLDPRGVSENRYFECVQNEPIPHYSRYHASGMILGAPSNWKLDHRASKYHTTKVVIFKLSRNQEMYDFDSSSLISSDQNLPFGRFVAFRKSLAESTYSLTALRAAVVEEQVHYSSSFIPLPQIDEDELVPDSQYAVPELENPQYTQRSKEINELICKAPHDAMAWLPLVKLQDSLAANSASAPSSRMQRIIREKKEAILERALISCPGDEHLLMVYMGLLEERLDSADMLTEWEQVLEDHPFSEALIFAYLDFRRSDFKYFTVTGYLDVLGEVMAKFSTSNVPNRASLCMRLFNHLTRFLVQSGYVERAIACFQALIEFNAFLPSALRGLDFGDRVSAMQDFWDAELPRFGEDGALGWAKGFSACGEEPPSNSCHTSRMDESADSDLRAWAASEKLQDYQNWLPLRGSVGDDDDPFRSILFEDVSPFLFDWNLSSDSQVATIDILAAIQHFMSLLGLNYGISPIADGSFGDIENYLDFDRVLSKTNSDISVPARLSLPLGGRCVLSELFFSSDEIRQLSLWLNRPAFIRMLLLQAVECTRSSDSASVKIDHLLSLLLVFEYSANPKGCMKLAKQLLKNHADRIALWAMYGTLLMRLRKHSDARKVFCTVFSSHDIPDLVACPSTCLILRKWMQCEGEEGRPKNGLAIAYSFATAVTANDRRLALDEASLERVISSSSATFSAVSILRVKSFFSALVKQCAAIGDAEQSVHWLVVCGLFDFFSKGNVTSGSITHALRVMEDHFYLWADKGDIHALELAYVEWVRFALWDAQVSPSFKPETARICCEKALALHPYNLQLWSFYQQIEASTKLENRFRRALEDAILSCESSPSPSASSSPSSVPMLSLYYAGIAFELSLPVPNKHILGSYFTRAMSTASCSRLAPWFWINAIRWEAHCRAGENQSHHSNIKSMLYRAMRHCPWAKDIYLLAFAGSLATAFSTKPQGGSEMNEDDPLLALQSIMEDKELRIRSSI